MHEGNAPRRSLAQFRRESLAFFSSDVEEHDACSLSGELTGASLANAARAPRHDGALAHEPLRDARIRLSEGRQ